MRTDVCVEARAVFYIAMLPSLAAVTALVSSIRYFLTSRGVDYVFVADYETFAAINSTLFNLSYDLVDYF